MNKHLIVSAQLTSSFLSLVTSEGKIFNIPQGRTDLPELIKLCQDYLVPGGEQLWLTVEQIEGSTIQEVRVSLAGPLKEIEEKSNGVIKFFRMARKAAAKLFNLDSQRDGTFIRIDDAHSVEEEVTYTATSVTTTDEDGRDIPEKAVQTSRIQEVMAQAKPITEKEINEGVAVSHETIVAVTPKGAMIGIEALEASLTQGDLTGTTKLIERLANVDHEHTAQDVLSFLKRGDLPVTKDGNIIAYKRLNAYTDPLTNLAGFIDVHSSTVFQRVTDVVQMSPHRVDRNRRKDCSVGLHVARRGYLGSFSGDRTVIILVRPEDVIAVPHRTPDKVRVSKYQIIYEASRDAARHLNSNCPLEKDKHSEELSIIQSLIDGWIPLPEAVVTVNGPAKDQVSRVLQIHKDAPPVPTPVVTEVATPLDTTNVVNTDNLKIVSQIKTSAKVDPSSVIAPTRKIEAKALYDKWVEEPTEENLQKLKYFKKKAKASWDTLGIPNIEAAAIKPAPLEVKKVEPVKPLTYKEQLAKLRPFNSRKKVNQALAIKKSAKKSWSTLGLTQDEQALIESWVS